MSSFPDTVADVPIARSRGLSPVRYAALATVGAVLGLATIWPAWRLFGLRGRPMH
jgi:hypothetical protein